jgi:hypothetical protein
MAEQDYGRQLLGQAPNKGEGSGCHGQRQHVSVPRQRELHPAMDGLLGNGRAIVPLRPLPVCGCH